MKKLHIIIALVLWGCAQIAEAQNMYRNYQSSTIIPQPQTAVSVVHSNGYVYYFQTDENGYLSVTEINPLSMNPTGNAKVFFPNLQNFIVYLNGGFEDTSGNFVLFGYQLQTHNIYMPQHPVYIIIAPNLSSCNVYYQNLLSGEFSAGCYGYNQNNTVSYLCNEQNACSHQYGGKSLKLDTGAQEAVATIAIKDNQEFVCEGFDGEIQYYLYDIAGRLLVQERTQNGIRNIVKKSNGIYLLQAFDSTGKRVVKKIVSL